MVAKKFTKANSYVRRTGTFGQEGGSWGPREFHKGTNGKNRCDVCGNKLHLDPGGGKFCDGPNCGSRSETPPALGSEK